MRKTTWGPALRAVRGHAAREDARMPFTSIATSSAMPAASNSPTTATTRAPCMRCGGVFAVSWTRRANALAALIRRADRGCGGSRRPLRTSYPRRHTEIIAELGVLPMLPILQTMFKKEIRAIVAGSDHFIRRLLHEPDIVAVLPDNGGAGWF